MRWALSDYRWIDGRLKKFLKRRGRSREESEDLIQDALLRLHEYCQSPGHSEAVLDREAFLVRTIRNLSIDRHRRDHRHLYVDETLEELEANLPLIDSGPSAHEILEAQKRLDRIRTTLNAVNPRTREIYFAHRAGYSYVEIGAHLGISKSTIEKHIARAVLALMDVKESER